MATIYTIIVIILLVLAISGLIVGVSNDAVNFLNSAIGSKAASRKVILTVASIGIIIGALTSNGMMEVARSGVFYPEAFTFTDVMMLFLGVMFANVILLDLFNTFGLPTSTTVSLVLGLLGASVAVATTKVAGSNTLTFADMTQFINAGKAMVIISAILVSVVIAFVFGSLLMFATRIVFSFRYKKVFARLGAMWCAIAFTAICYFTLFKGLKSAGFINPEVLNSISDNMTFSLFATWVVCSILMYVLQHVFKLNILKITILVGTFALALAFAGNDLVNFIGVPIAGYDSYQIAVAHGTPDMLMGELNEPVKARFLFLLVAGIVMVLALWFSKKAQSVSDTEINLAKQDEGAERFGSTLFSRSLVRLAMGTNKSFSRYMPERLQRAIDKRFIPLRDNDPEKASFDLIRATLNMTVAAILISSATSLKLPLSTTYVTFMVAMGSSLADRAWGRESAVYRITGVLTVISGWFVTALVAFALAYAISMVLVYGGTVAVVVVTVLCSWMLLKSHLMHKKRVEKQECSKQRISANKDGSDDALTHCISETNQAMDSVTRIYKETLVAVFNEDRRALRTLLKESNEIFYDARERKYEVLPILKQLKQENFMDTGHYYVQVVDYMSEVSKALVHIVRPCFEHIDNNHEGFSKEQIADLIKISDEVTAVNIKIDNMLRNNDFTNIDEIMTLRDLLFVQIEDAQKNQLHRIKRNSSSTKSSMLYLNILNETKTMMLQSRNLLKSQKYFLHGTQEVDLV